MLEASDKLGISYCSKFRAAVRAPIDFMLLPSNRHFIRHCMLIYFA
jgi:hypothetical protein